jgi:hypothetical protein
VMANTWVCIFGDRQHMGDWPPGVILSCWVWLSGTPSPQRLPPAQKPKLRQQTREPQATSSRAWVCLKSARNNRRIKVSNLRRLPRLDRPTNKRRTIKRPPAPSENQLRQLGDIRRDQLRSLQITAVIRLKATRLVDGIHNNALCNCACGEKLRLVTPVTYHNC